ncbi:hypothetical protein BH11BAC4_BH11BAC4_07850 [soil metagenome]
MTTKKDIETRQDIEAFLIAFYEKVKTDKTIGIIFTEIVAIDWKQHIRLIADFWESILLDNPVYKKNAMEVHYALNRIFPLKQKHFDAWLVSFNDTLDKMYAGDKTELAKKRALSIAMLMEHKMNNSQSDTSII